MSGTLPLDRKPWVAASLSMLCCGLGQIYCGRAGRGLVMYSLSMLFGPIVIATVMTGSSLPWLIAFLLSLIAIAVVTIGSVIDAHRLAKSLAGQQYEPRDYNRPVVYRLMALTSITYAFVLAMFLRANVTEAFMIPSRSMAPTLVPGDRLLTNKLGINARTLERGELVVFRHSANREQLYVKRIVGLPGDTVELRQGEVLVNGQPLKREPIGPAATDSKQLVYEWNGGRRYQILIGPDDENADLPPQTVPDGAYFVMGDNRGLSLDSRNFNAVSHGEIVGVVTYRYWPAGNWSRFGVVP
ncbi:MAG TPA: signal peptidase I [Planctomycetaceae bacterium]|nr:signal peptidase I [Planctomycetaceae bacterium]